LAVAAVVASMAVTGAVGGAIGVVLGSSGVVGTAVLAASTSPTPTPAAGGSAPASGATGSAPSGKFVPNEDPTHEQGESAAREAQENAGQRPTVP
jgi:hypothetical protein